MRKLLTVFVDSDAFIALLKESDMSHERAKDLFLRIQDQPVRFLTSNYVFSETVTVLSQRVSHSVAVRYIESMTASASPFVITRADETIEHMAIQIFQEQRSKNTSYVDCTNIALMKHLNLDAIFSFDRVYRQHNLPLVEDVITNTSM